MDPAIAPLATHSAPSTFQSCSSPIDTPSLAQCRHSRYLEVSLNRVPERRSSQPVGVLAHSYPRIALDVTWLHCRLADRSRRTKGVDFKPCTIQAGPI